MQYNTLSSLISSLEYGTKLHIGVLFLDCYGNRKTRRPTSQVIHTCPVCDLVKRTDFDSCFRCRNTVLKLVIKHRKTCAGYCTKGVYEYSRPIVRNDTVVGMIFVGNILTDDPKQLERLSKYVKKPLLRTMEKDFTLDDCHRTVDILESYIHYLLDRYGETTQESYGVLIENIKSYIDENLLHDFSMSDLSSVFNYNEKYLGRLFRQKTGTTIKEYCNIAKIKKAKHLLRDSQLTIAAVAGQVGYNNVTYFNRTFKRLTGVSPQVYRNEPK